MICPYCNNEVSYEQAYCPSCGAALPATASAGGKVILHGYTGGLLVETKIVCSIENTVVAEVGKASRSTKVPIEVPITHDCNLEYKFKSDWKLLFSWGCLQGSQSIRLQAGKTTHVYFSIDPFIGFADAKVTVE